MGFTEVYEDWLSEHLKSRSGEKRSRLERGHGHGEQLFLKKAWWAIFGHLDDLHPEYEVADWRGRPYFIDFAWMPGKLKFAIEIKGYGPHVQNADRIRYRHELNREIYLQILDFRVVAVPYDELESQPELVISLLKSLFAPYLAESFQKDVYSRLERDVMLLALRQNQPIRPVDLIRELGINRRTAVNCLKALSEKGKFKPMKSNGSDRVNRYEYIHSLMDKRLW